MHCKEISIYVFLFWEFRGLSPNFHIHSCVCEPFIYSQDRSTYSPAAEQADRSLKYINLSQTYECRNWEKEHYNSVWEITVSFLRIHKWEPDICIGFSPTLHLQCGLQHYTQAYCIALCLLIQIPGILSVKRKIITVNFYFFFSTILACI